MASRISNCKVPSPPIATSVLQPAATSARTSVRNSPADRDSKNRTTKFRRANSDRVSAILRPALPPPAHGFTKTVAFAPSIFIVVYEIRRAESVTPAGFTQGTRQSASTLGVGLESGQF